MLKNIQEIIRQRIDKGLNTYKNIFELGAGHTPEAINVVYNNDGSRGKRLGASTLNAIALESTAGYGMYDFGVLGVGGNDANTKLLLHGNGVIGDKTFTDSSTRNYAVSGSGGVGIDTAQSKFGGASILFPAAEDSNTKLLLHFDGVDGSTTFIDEIGKVVTANGNVQIDTAQSVFGGASGLFDGTGDYLTIPDHADFYLDGDFTVDFRLRYNAINATTMFFEHKTDANNFYRFYYNNANQIYFNTRNASVETNASWSWTPSTNTWYHIEVSRSGNNMYCFIDGVSLGTVAFSAALVNPTGSFYIGIQSDGVSTPLNGWLDEFRISKGIARHTANFTVPANPYGTGYLLVPDNDDWYFGLANFSIDKQVRFNSVLTSQMLIGQGVSTSNQWYLQYGSAPNSLLFRSYSGGALVVNVSGLWTPTTATWYHMELVRNSTNSWYIFVNGSSLAAAGTTAGIIPQLAAPMIVGINAANTSNGIFDGWMDEIRVSNNARHTADFTAPSVAYSSDILQERRLLCAAGTGVYYSSDIGKTFAIIQTNRTANINYFGFIKDYVINTNESYDPPQYWAGTATQYFANISTATPACKHSASHQGFAILMNESANKTGFYYVDQNSMFNSAWSNFKLPTGRNDELTAGFSLGRTLYVSSKYKIFRLDYIGGNPDWEYVDVKDWGFVPKTVRKVNIQGMGEAVIGLDWSKKIRIFFGSDDEVLSDSIAKDNSMSPFYLDNISAVDLNKCWAEDDRKAGVYRLFVAYANSATVSYSINFNYRAGSLYAENNRPYQSGILATDTADNQLMLACNYNGKVVVMDSGNTEAGTAIDEYHTSSFIYNRSPSRVSKKQQVDLFLSATSSGTFYYEDRNDFSNVWTLRKTMTLANAISAVQIRHTIDIPETVNVYQFKFSSSANTAEPWNMNLVDLSFGDMGIGKG